MPVRTVEEARAWRAKIRSAVVDTPNNLAYEIAQIYPPLPTDGSLIPYKSRYQFDGKLMQAKQDLWALESNDPAHLPSGWTWIRYKDGYRYINEAMYGDEAFAKDEIGYYEPHDKFYRSRIDNNTWPPSAYPGGWEEQA